MLVSRCWADRYFGVYNRLPTVYNKIGGYNMADMARVGAQAFLDRYVADALAMQEAGAYLPPSAVRHAKMMYDIVNAPVNNDDPESLTPTINWEFL